MEDKLLSFTDQAIVARLCDKFELRVRTGIKNQTIPFRIKGARITDVTPSTNSDDLGFSTRAYCKQFEKLRDVLRQLGVEFTIASVHTDSPQFTIIACSGDEPYLVWNRYDPPGDNKSGSMNRVFINGKVYTVDHAVRYLGEIVKGSC